MGTRSSSRLQCYSVYYYACVQLVDHLQREIRQQSSIKDKKQLEKETTHDFDAHSGHIFVYVFNAAKCNCAHIFSRTFKNQILSTFSEFSGK
jgi:hypothetical protein